MTTVPFYTRTIIKILRLFGRLPFRIRSNMGAFLGTICSHLDRRDFQVALMHLNYFNNHDLLTLRDPASTARSAFAHTGRTIFESIDTLSPLLTDKISVSLNRTDLLEKLRTSPHLILTAHLGNWELMGSYAHSENIRLNAIARSAKSKFANDILTNLRKNNGQRILYKDQKNLLRTILQCWNTGESVAALLDQDMDGRGNFYPFFSLQTKTNTSLIEFAIKRNIPILSAFCIRNSASSFQIVASEIDSRTDLDQILLQYHTALEALIRDHPAQWVWFHKRWRSVPGKPRLRTSEYIQTNLSHLGVG